MKYLIILSLLSVKSFAASYHVRGECEKDMISDRAFLSVGVSHTEKTASKAQEKSTKVYQALLEKIKSSKLSHEQIQTESIQLYEDFDWIKGKKSSKGFVSTMSLKVSTSDFAKLSNLIPTFSEIGATQIGQLQLFVSPEVTKTTYQDCLGVAALEARKKAMAIHKEFSKSDLKLVEIREVSAHVSPQPYMMKAAMDMEAASGPSIEAGKQSISVKLEAQFKD